MARVFTRQRTWLDPVLRPDRAADLPARPASTRRARCAGPSTPSRCCCSASSRCWCSTRCSALQQCAAVEPAGLRRASRRTSRSTPPRRSRPTRTGRRTAARSTMSYFTQMAGLAYHNFVSAAAGIARRDRVHPRHRAEGEGHARQLLGRPGARARSGCCCRSRIVGALFLVSQGVVQNLRPYDKVAVIDPQTVTTTGRRRQAADDRRARADDRAGAGGVAGDHQAVRHQRRRLLQRQQRASVREPDAADELPRDVRHLRDLGRASPTRSGR